MITVPMVHPKQWQMHGVPPGDHLVVKFLINANGKIGINASGTTWWLNLQLSESNNTFSSGNVWFLSRVDSRELPECEEAFSCSPDIYKSVSLLTISLVHSVPCADLCSRIHWAEMLLVCQNLNVAHFKIFIHPKYEKNRKKQANKKHVLFLVFKRT